jgi:phosphatidylinositol glycan class Z
LYNARASNLAQHGLHPRATHAALNAPLLFAPLLPPAGAAVLAALRATRARRRAATTLSSLPPAGADAVALTLAAAVALPLLGLSCAPHQEPRFLLPLLLPLAALGGAGALSSRRRVALFLAFNAPLALFYGGAHQAGVLPAAAAVSGLLHGRGAPALVAALARSAHAPVPAACAAAAATRDAPLAPPAVHALFWRTYPPPESLLLMPRQHDAASAAATRHMQLSDIRDASPDALAAALAAPSPACGACWLRLLAAPALAPMPAGAEEVALFWPHFSGEDIGDALNALAAGAPLRRAFGLALYALPPAACEAAAAARDVA